MLITHLLPPRLKARSWDPLFFNILLSLFIFAGSLSLLHGQGRVAGSVVAEASGLPIVGARVMLDGSTLGALTNESGSFSFKVPNSPPFDLVVTYYGFDSARATLTSFDQKLKINMVEAEVTLDAVEIVQTASAERKKQSPLTVESMSINAIKETPAANFYDGLGALKEVDLNAASIGFKVINTRGFNSAAPVRSLQIIDGVDNQAPGLNFALGNFLGASELDIELVDLIIGASSAYYGPNAFNGVVSMKTKSPFIHKGLSVMAKGGERNMGEFALRYARAFQNKQGRDIFAFKVNGYYLRADDWEADNIDAVDGTIPPVSNPGGYDAVNRYGDENIFDGNSAKDQFFNPGLGNWARTGYLETDLVDYDTRNLKLAAALHFLLNRKVELIAASNFGYGTTVLQGDNRYSLRDITFLQNRIELREQGKFFLRAYSTNENAGNSYDAVFTALRLQDRVKSDGDWSLDYRNFWAGNLPFGNPLRGIGGSGLIENLEGYPEPTIPFTDENEQALAAFLAANADTVAAIHNLARQFVDFGDTLRMRLEPGTPEFEEAFREITNTPLYRGGTKLVDRSSLYHIQGEYNFTPSWMENIKVGFNSRLYAPISEGSIFQDTLSFVNDTLPDGSIVEVDSSFTRITNFEYGIYAGIEKRLLNDNLKINATLRIDKNQNFNFVSSYAASLVYNINEDHVVRLSLSSAIRNPTLADQYLFYNVGNAVLLGNLEGFTRLADTASFIDYLADVSKDTSQIQYFDVDPIQPEKVQTIEVGYRANFNNRLYADASYYFSRYRDFIGFVYGVDIAFSPFNGILQSVQAYRIAANATDVVTTQGFSLGMNYYFENGLSFNGNYSWNRLNSQSDDPIIPAYNTPEHKFNLGISGRDMHIKDWRHIGFAVNYKWIQGFLFEGSPQFTGNIPTYYLLDAQFSQNVPDWNTTFKLGAANILNRQQFQIYGGPRVGRLVYFSAIVDLKEL